MSAAILDQDNLSPKLEGLDPDWCLGRRVEEEGRRRPGGVGDGGFLALRGLRQPQDLLDYE